MIDLAFIFFIGAVASIGVLIIAPVALIYIAAFVAFTPILGIVLWRASAALLGRTVFEATHSATPSSRASLRKRGVLSRKEATKPFWMNLSRQRRRRVPDLLIRHVIWLGWGPLKLARLRLPSA